MAKIPADKELPNSKTSSGTVDKDKLPIEDNVNNNGVYVVNTPDRDRTTSFFAQPGILAGKDEHLYCI